MVLGLICFSSTSELEGQRRKVCRTKFDLVASRCQVWNLRKCSGSDAASCLGKNEIWNDASVLRSGDVVAWVSAADSRVQATRRTVLEVTTLPC